MPIIADEYSKLFPGVTGPKPPLPDLSFMMPKQPGVNPVAMPSNPIAEAWGMNPGQGGGAVFDFSGGGTPKINTNPRDFNKAVQESAMQNFDRTLQSGNLAGSSFAGTPVATPEAMKQSQQNKATNPLVSAAQEQIAPPDTKIQNEVNQMFLDMKKQMPWLDTFGGPTQESYARNYQTLSEQGLSPDQIQAELGRRAAVNRPNIEHGRENQQIAEFLNEPNPIREELRQAQATRIGVPPEVAADYERRAQEYDKQKGRIAQDMRTQAFAQRMTRKAVEDPTRNMTMAEKFAYKNPKKAKAAQERWDRGEATAKDAWMLGYISSQDLGKETGNRIAVQGTNRKGETKTKYRKETAADVLSQHNREAKQAVALRDIAQAKGAGDIAKLGVQQQQINQEGLAGAYSARLGDLKDQMAPLIAKKQEKGKLNSKEETQLAGLQAQYDTMFSQLQGLYGGGKTSGMRYSNAEEAIAAYQKQLKRDLTETEKNQIKAQF